MSQTKATPRRVCTRSQTQTLSGPIPFALIMKTSKGNYGYFCQGKRKPEGTRSSKQRSRAEEFHFSKASGRGRSIRRRVPYPSLPSQSPPLPVPAYPSALHRPPPPPPTPLRLRSYITPLPSLPLHPSYADLGNEFTDSEITEYKVTKLLLLPE